MQEQDKQNDTPTPPPESLFLTSDSTDKLDEALAKAQGEMEGALKDSENPYFKSRYADLASVWAACRAPLSKYKISVTQWPIHSEDSHLHIITRLAHLGQWMQSEFSLPVAKVDPQGYVAAATYARRCALSAAVGVAPEDDDGNAAAAAMNGMKNKTQATLEEAAKRGSTILQEAWSKLTNDARKAVQAEMPRIKDVAKRVDDSIGKQP